MNSNKQRNPINILVTLDSNYIEPLCVMLKSLFLTNPGETFHIYVIYSHIKNDELVRLDVFCRKHGSELRPILVPKDMFADAPVSRYYSKAMYYRLLAYELLPSDMEKILYLDPDILIINSLRPLYETDISSRLFGAAIHTSFTGISEQINRLRLQSYETEGYYNSGVLLMNLDKQRREMRAEDIYDYVRKNENKLILPDQDVLNALFGEQTLPLDDSLYNYDARRYETYRLTSVGEKDMDWVMKHTVILHFCGSAKPWQKGYAHRFGVLYKHYMQLTEKST